MSAALLEREAHEGSTARERSSRGQHCVREKFMRAALRERDVHEGSTVRERSSRE